MWYSQIHRQPRGASPASPEIIKTQIILIFCPFLCTPRASQWLIFSLFTTGGGMIRCGPQKGVKPADYSESSLSPKQATVCLGWCWHPRCVTLKRHIESLFPMMGGYRGRIPTVRRRENVFLWQPICLPTSNSIHPQLGPANAYWQILLFLHKVHTKRAHHESFHCTDVNPCITGLWDAPVGLRV